jgi:outer membrane protein OmpA-like peptidoglycan-associated protein
MKLRKKLFYLLFFFHLFLDESQSQWIQIDADPQFDSISAQWMLDRISYGTSLTQVSLRYVSDKEQFFHLYPQGYVHAWYIQTLDTFKNRRSHYPVLEIKQIELNRQPIISKIQESTLKILELQKGDLLTLDLVFAHVDENHFDLKQDHPLLSTQIIGIRKKTNLGDADSLQQVLKQRILTFQAQYPYIDSIQRNSIGLNDTVVQSVRDSFLIAKLEYKPKELIAEEDLHCDTRVILPAISFEDNQSSFEMNFNAHRDVKILFDYLVKFPKARMRLHGHSDIFGNESSNYFLSKQRALLVKEELLKLGIESERIEVFHYGGSQPLLGYEKGGKENRRVEAEPLCR